MSEKFSRKLSDKNLVCEGRVETSAFHSHVTLLHVQFIKDTHTIESVPIALWMRKKSDLLRKITCQSQTHLNCEKNRLHLSFSLRRNKWKRYNFTEFVLNLHALNFKKGSGRWSW